MLTPGMHRRPFEGRHLVHIKFSAINLTLQGATYLTQTLLSPS